MLITAICIDLAWAIIATIIAHRTNLLGLGWLVAIAWVLTAILLGYATRTRIAVSSFAILIAVPIALTIFEFVWLPLMRSPPH